MDGWVWIRILYNQIPLLVICVLKWLNFILFINLYIDVIIKFFCVLFNKSICNFYLILFYCNFFYLWICTWIVHALTSSWPDVKKYCNCSALYPCMMILSSALYREKRETYNKQMCFFIEIRIGLLSAEHNKI